MESIQLLNTAIIKSKEKKIDNSYDERLKELCKSPVFEALNKAIISLSEGQKISRDQASMQIIETIRELDSIWNDYVTMEGIQSLRNFLKTQSH